MLHLRSRSALPIGEPTVGISLERRSDLTLLSDHPPLSGQAQVRCFPGEPGLRRRSMATIGPDTVLIDSSAPKHTQPSTYRRDNRDVETPRMPKLAEYTEMYTSVHGIRPDTPKCIYRRFHQRPPPKQPALAVAVSRRVGLDHRPSWGFVTSKNDSEKEAPSR